MFRGTRKAALVTESTVAVGCLPSVRGRCWRIGAGGSGPVDRGQTGCYRTSHDRLPSRPPLVERSGWGRFSCYRPAGIPVQ